jgi:hypothetical protein
MAYNAPKKYVSSQQPINNSDQGNKRTGLARAWNSWLQPAVVMAVFAAIMIAGYMVVKNELLPKDLIGTIVACALLVVPLLSVIQQLIEDQKAGSIRRYLSIALLLIVSLASFAPVLWLVLPSSIVVAGELENLGQVIEIPAGSETGDWLTSVQGDLGDTQNQYTASYGIRVESGDNHELLKGKFERKLGINNQTGEKEYYSLDKDLHRFTMDLSEKPHFRLYKADTETGTIAVTLRSQLASWSYFWIVILPLILFSVVVDIAEKADRKLPFYSARISFMLWFGFIFANTTKPDDFTGAIFVSAAVGLVFALAVAATLPRFLSPILSKIPGLD